MDVGSIALQQAGAQTNAAVSMLKKTAQAEQALVKLIDQAIASGNRGQNLDITV